jgi:hypothetical protein
MAHPTCAYVSSVSLAIEFVQQSSAYLFTNEEKQIFHTFTSLSYSSKRIFCRLLTRRSTWIRSSSLLSYLGPSATNNDLETALSDLSSSKFIEIFISDSNFDISWKCFSNLCKLEEIHDIYNLLLGSKTKIPKGTREDLLKSLFHQLSQQKTLTCFSLKDRFSKCLYAYLRKNDVYNMLPCKLDEDIVILFRRVQRLYQV